MKTCAACGKTSLAPTNIGGKDICKICYMKIHGSSWNKDEYFDSLNDLNKWKTKAIDSAKKCSFPDEVINTINNFFQKEIDKGFIKSFYGQEGQWIALYKDYFVIDTKDYFDRDEINKQLKLRGAINTIAKTLTTDNSTLMNTGMNMISGIIPGGKFVRNGVKLAMGAAIDAAKSNANDPKVKEQPTLPTQVIAYKGVRTLRYEDYDKIIHVNGSDKCPSYFYILGDNVPPYMFFFDHSYESEASEFEGDLLELFNSHSKPIPKDETESPKEIEQSHNSPMSLEAGVDGIRKFKQLLDEGIITEEEFLKKKKELLGL